MGSDKTHERLIRTLAEESGAAVVFRFMRTRRKTVFRR